MMNVDALLLSQARTFSPILCCLLSTYLFPLTPTHIFFNLYASTHHLSNSTARQKNHLFAPPSYFRKPYKCALPLSPHFCSRKLIPRPQAGASSKWSRLEARGHHSMARKHLTFLPSLLMEVTLVSVLFKRPSDRPVHQPSTTPHPYLLPSPPMKLNVTLESILTI